MNDLDEIADRNDPYGNDGSRDKRGRGRKRGSIGACVIAKKNPKWKSQLRGLKAGKARKSGHQ